MFAFERNLAGERLPNEFKRSVTFRSPSANDGFRFGQLRGGHDRNLRFDDSGLFRRRFRQGCPEPFLMIEIDRRNDGNDGLGSIGRVEPAAHPGLKDDDFGFAFLEMQKAKRSHNFEESRIRIPVGDKLIE